MDTIINLLPLAGVVLLVATVCANPVLSLTKGTFDRVEYKHPKLRWARTVVYFRDGQVCILKGEHNIGHSPGTDIVVAQRKSGAVEISVIGVEEKEQAAA